MTAQNFYIDFVKNDVATIIDSMQNEVLELELYKAKLQQEGKPVAFIEIRINNNLKRIAIIQKLIQLSNDAISELPKNEPQQSLVHNTSNRVRLIDLPEYSNEQFLSKIYNLVTQINDKL
jgi:hypothetical protein